YRGDPEEAEREFTHKFHYSNQDWRFKGDVLLLLKGACCEGQTPQRLLWGLTVGIEGRMRIRMQVAVSGGRVRAPSAVRAGHRRCKQACRCENADCERDYEGEGSFSHQCTLLRLCGTVGPGAGTSCAQSF